MFKFDKTLASSKPLFQENLPAAFQVVGYKIGETPNGFTKLTLSLLIMDANKKSGKFNATLVASENTTWVIKQFCLAIGRPDLFESNCLLEKDLIGAEGECIFKTKIDATGKYDPESEIKAYLPKIAVAPAHDPDFNDKF